MDKVMTRPMGRNQWSVCWTSVAWKLKHTAVSTPPLRIQIDSNHSVGRHRGDSRAISQMKTGITNNQRAEPSR